MKCRWQLIIHTCFSNSRWNAVVGVADDVIRTLSQMVVGPEKRMWMICNPIDQLLTLEALPAGMKVVSHLFKCAKFTAIGQIIVPIPNNLL